MFSVSQYYSHCYFICQWTPGLSWQRKWEGGCLHHWVTVKTQLEINCNFKSSLLACLFYLQAWKFKTILCNTKKITLLFIVRPIFFLIINFCWNLQKNVSFRFLSVPDWIINGEIETKISYALTHTLFYMGNVHVSVLVVCCHCCCLSVCLFAF